MEIIDKDDRENVCLKRTVTNKDLFETIEKGKGEELRQLLKGYFSMVEHLGDSDYLINNMNYYNETLSKLIDFSHTSFMEKIVWRVSDNGQFEECCGAHLRNLLSPFKNQIFLIKDFSEGEIEEDLFKSFIDRVEGTFEKNKKLFLEFCEFLEKKDK